MKKIFVFLTSIALATSCSTDIDSNIAMSSPKETIIVNASIASQTRVSVSESAESEDWTVSWAEEDTLGCWDQDASNSACEKFTVNAVSADGESATFTGSPVATTSSMRFIHPYSSEFIKDGSNNVALSLEVQEVGDGFDHLATTTYMISGSFSAGDSSINMSHIGAALELKMKFSDELGIDADKYDITKIEFGSGLPIAGEVNLESGDFSAAAYGAMTLTASNIAAVDGIYTLRCSTFPFEIAAESSIPFTVTFVDASGCEFTATSSLTVNAASSVERAGKNTIYFEMDAEPYTEEHTATITGITNGSINSGQITTMQDEGSLDSDLSTYTRLVVTGGSLGSLDWSTIASSFTNLKYIDVSGTTSVSVGGSAFKNHTSLEGIALPTTITSIGGSAFLGCTSLKAIELPSNLGTLSASAFSGCTALTEVTIPASITVWSGSGVSNTAFLNCTSLKTVIFEEGLTVIGANSFSGCTALEAINLPSTLQTWEDNASAQSLAFQNCSGVTSISIPEGITEIGALAFSNCTGVTTVTIPSTVKSWPKSSADVNQAFQGCTGLDSVILADGLTTICSNVFQGASNITSFTSYSVTPPAITSATVSNTADCYYAINAGKLGCAVYVPAEAIVDYKAATGWSAQTNYIAIEE